MNAWFSLELTILLQVTAITLGAAIAMGIARRRAALRHAIGVVALALVLASPALALLLPRAAWLGGVAASGTPPLAAPDHSAAKVIDHRDQELELSAESIVAQSEIPVEGTKQLHATTTPSTPITRPAALAANRAVWLARAFALASLIWAAGGVMLCLRFVAALRQLRRFADSIEPASIDRSVAEEASRALCLMQLPPVRISDLAPMPLVLGCWRPMVVLPRQLFVTGSAVRVRDVLIHECAHISRRDPWVNVAQHVAGVIFWPHPGVHWLGRQIARSREEVCDNFVLSGANPTDYAQTLLELAEQCAGPRFAVSLLGMFSRRWSLEERISGILGPDRIKATRAGRLPLAAAALLLAATCALVGGAGALAQVSKQSSAAPAPGSIVAVEVVEDDAQPNTPPRPVPKIDVTPPTPWPVFPPADATPARIVSGTVTDAADKPVAGAQVWLPARSIGLHETLTAKTRSDDAGRFELSVPEAWLANSSLWNGGMDIVWAYAPGHAIGRRYAGDQLLDKEFAQQVARDKDLKVLFDVNSNQPLVIALPAESETRLVIRSSDGKPAVGAKVLPCAYPAHPHRNYPSELSEKLLVETSDANGEVRFKAVGSDHAPATFTIRMARHGEQVFTAQVLVSEGRTVRFQPMPPEQRIKLIPAGRIEGRIVGERLELVRGRTVLVESEYSWPSGQPRLTGVAEATIDDEGRFVIPEIAAGPLRVWVKCDKRLAVQPRPPDLFDVSVEARQTLDLEIPLEPCVRVHGLVRLKQTGRPVAGARVYFNPGWLHRQQTAITDEKGEYSAYVLGGDKVEVQIDHNLLSDYLQLGDPRAEHAVPRGVDDFELPAIEMARTERIAGLLLDVDGKPLADATIRNFADHHREGVGVSNAKGEFTLVDAPAGTELKGIDVHSGGKRFTGVVESVDPLVVRAKPETNKD